MKEQQQDENKVHPEQSQNNTETEVNPSDDQGSIKENPDDTEASLENVMNIPVQDNTVSDAAEKIVTAEEPLTENSEKQSDITKTNEFEGNHLNNSEGVTNDEKGSENMASVTQEKYSEANFNTDEEVVEQEIENDVEQTESVENSGDLIMEETEDEVKPVITAGTEESISDNTGERQESSEEEITERELSTAKSGTTVTNDVSESTTIQESLAAENISETDDDEDSDHDDGERDIEMEELESSENYTDLEPEELVSRMGELVKEQDPEPVRKKFFALRKAYFDNQKKERELAYNSFIEGGGAIEDYQIPSSTPRDETMRELTQQFKQKLTQKRERREKEKQDNLAAKRQIIEDLKAVIQNEANILQAFDAIHELQAKWRSIGIVPLDQAEDLWQSYRFYVGKFYDLIRIHKELQELDQKKNLEAKVIICGQAEDLLLEPSINKAITQLRELQDKWRDIGPVPKENNEEIWDRFKSVADQIYERRRNHIESLRGEQEENLLKKTELCDRTEKLVEQRPEKPGEWQKLTDELKQLQQEWKNTGPAPRQQNEKIWQRFRAAGDKHFNDKKDYFSNLKREQDNNKQKKTDICVQAESLKDSTEWKETADTLKNLQEEWKNIGPVHPKYSQKLWERFRTACDAFFSQRSLHHTEQDKEYSENLVKKTSLVEDIEKFESSDNKSQDLDKLKEAQKQWSEIGRVPIKVKDKIYQRYRRALDKCYEKLNLSFADRRNISSSDRIQQLEQGGKQLTPKDKSSVRFKIDKLQDEIRLLENNIGFFSNSKGASKLKEDYEKKIEMTKMEVNNLKALLSKS